MRFVSWKGSVKAVCRPTEYCSMIFTMLNDPAQRLSISFDQLEATKVTLNTTTPFKMGFRIRCGSTPAQIEIRQIRPNWGCKEGSLVCTCDLSKRSLWFIRKKPSNAFSDSYSDLYTDSNSDSYFDSYTLANRLPISARGICSYSRH